MPQKIIIQKSGIETYPDNMFCYCKHLFSKNDMKERRAEVSADGVLNAI